MPKIEDPFFLECPECMIEYNYDDVKVISALTDHRGITICRFLCPCCNEETDSILTGVM
jgi:hypothetical protein